jgi:6-bladed beta-propeller protein
MKLLSIVGLFLLTLTGLQCSSNRQLKISKSKDPDQFNIAIKGAVEHAPTDEIARAFQITETIKLSEGRIQNLSRVIPKTDGSLLILDIDRKQVEAYDRAGHFLRQIGEPGQKPGSHQFPSDISEVEEGNVAVCDFTTHRVSVFSSDGNFLRSFIYAPQRFSASKMLFDQDTNSYFLFGNRWEKNEQGKASGATLVHKYSTNGEFISSSLPFPDDAKRLDLYTYDEPLADISHKEVYVTLPFRYKIDRLTPDGQLEEFIKGGSEEFRPPSTPISIEKGTDPIFALNNWRMTWTPIDSVVVNNGYLIVQIQTFDPLRYTIDFWSLSTKRRAAQIKTNHSILASSKDGDLYLLNNIDVKGQTQYVILRAKLNIPKET